jgi:hypothetical protein
MHEAYQVIFWLESALQCWHWEIDREAPEGWLLQATGWAGEKAEAQAEALQKLEQLVRNTSHKE